MIIARKKVKVIQTVQKAAAAALLPVLEQAGLILIIIGKESESDYENQESQSNYYRKESESDSNSLESSCCCNPPCLRAGRIDSDHHEQRK